MNAANDKNASSTFTVISQEGMDLINSFDQPSEVIPLNEDLVLLPHDVDTLPKINNKPKQWMKIEPCVNNCNLKISEVDQKNIFDSYWNNATVVSRYKFVTESSQLYSPKDYHEGSAITLGDKKYYVFYSLNTVDGYKNVCKICFRFILREQEAFIKAVLAQKLITFNDEDDDSVINDDSLINDGKFPNYAQFKTCSMKCNVMVSDKEKKQNLYNYWHETTIDQRCKFILDMTEMEENPRYKSNVMKGLSRKPYICKFHLETSFGRQLVCMNCFCLILRESICIVTEILDEKWSELSSEFENGEKYNQVIKHINKFPLFESHHVTDSGNEKYLPRGLTLEAMYHLYKTETANAVNFLMYQRIFEKTKLRFLSSIVEKCLQCEVANHESQSTNLSKNKIRLESFITSHLNVALKSHSFKARDEKRKVQTLRICTFKFHQSLPTPFVNNPIHYYTEPLWTYNLTIMETSKCKPTDGTFKSYVWNESQGQKSVNEIASCLNEYLRNLPSHIKTVVFYSTSCNGESRSKLLCMILSNIVVNHPSLILLEHKFLLDGHFYSDKNKKNDWCQDVLSNNVGKIQVPRDWYNVLSEIATENQSEVIVMDNSKFYDFKGLLGGRLSDSIDGGKIDDDVTCIQYAKNGTIYFKKKWSGCFEVMYSEIYSESHKTNFFPNLSNTNRTLITEKKKNNLLNLLPFLSFQVHDFYKNLPTENSRFESNLQTVSTMEKISPNEIADSTVNGEQNLDKIYINVKTERNEEEDLNKADEEKGENSEKEEIFNPRIVKVEPNCCDPVESEEDENFSLVLPEVCVVKEEIDIDNNEKATFDNKFSDDESEDEIENSMESEQSLDNLPMMTPLFSKIPDSQIKEFNEKFYQDPNSQNTMEIMKNFEITSEKRRITTNDNTSDDCSSGMNVLMKMRQFQPLSQCSNLCYLKVSPQEQKRIFTAYWHTGTSDSRFNFLYDTIKVGPKSFRNKKFPEEQVQFSVKFVIDTERGPQALCKFCYTKLLCDRPSEITTVLKLKAQTLIDGIKNEVYKLETGIEERMDGTSKTDEMRTDISKWKTAEYDNPSSKLLRMEKLHKGWTQLQPCRNGCFLTIKSQDQEQIYNSYWQDATTHSRYYFIKASVKINKSRSSTEVKSSRKYYHNSSIGPQRVCKRCFCLVLGETLSFVETVLRNSGIAGIKKKMAKTSQEAENSVTNSQKDPQVSSSINTAVNETQEESKTDFQKDFKIKICQESKQIENHETSSQQSSHQSTTPGKIKNLLEVRRVERINTKIKEKINIKAKEKVTDITKEKSNDKAIEEGTQDPSNVFFGMMKQIQTAQEHIHNYLNARMKNNPLKINVQTMFVQYLETVPDPLSIGWYQNILSVNNVNYKPAFIGKCDECETYADKFKSIKNLPMREKICDRLTSHLEYSTIVYKCKFQEEESARLINSMMVCSFGFQQNFPIPSRNKSKQLSIFNLTIWQLTNNHLLENPMFYVWPQVEGKRTANEIASCLFQYLKKIPGQVKSLIIYSSSCHGESKHKTLAQMFSYLMLNHKSLVSVDHKFTYSGHSQLKEYLNDNWISDVIKNHPIKADEPEDWYKNFKNTVKHMKKKNIVFMEPEMFVDFESLWKSSLEEEVDSYINPEAMWLKYTKNGNVFFKKSLLERHNFELLVLQGQQQFQDLLNMQLFSLLDSCSETNENPDQCQLDSSVPQPDQTIIKTEIDFDADQREFADQNDEEYQDPSQKRRRSENEPAREETPRSKRIRKKREILSL